MVFCAQTGFCRWRVLLEYFGEPLPFEGERCGLCDNCLRPAQPPAAEPADGDDPRPASERPRFAPGTPVTVPRYGSGRVASASADEVAVRFADGSLRRFVADQVRDAADPAA
jgi:ATP-dependent DNA helicase RecQ